MKRLCWQFFLLLLSVPFYSLQAAFVVSRQGVPQAAIVVDANGEGPLLFAAEELQHWLQELTGAKLPIRHDLETKQPKIILAVKPEGFTADLAAIGNLDGYAVRERDGDLFVIGTRAKGVLNGVFRMLQKNTDIIWAHVNEEYGTIFSKNRDLTLQQTNYLDVPQLSLRGWQFNTAAKELELWSLRNGSNHGAPPPELWDKAGYIKACGGGHNLTGRFLKPSKYFAEHPEFYPLIKGERNNSARVQLCFTNQEMTKAFIKELDDFIRQNLEYDTVNVHIEDSYKLCECDNCLKPITIGTETVTIEDKNKFRSTQYFLFLNQVARHVAQHFPDKLIRTYAYFFTQEPPICLVEDNIRVLLAFIYKDARYPLQDDANEKTRDMFLGWAKMTNGLMNRDYYGLTREFPRPADFPMLTEVQFMKQHGLVGNYAEITRDRAMNPKLGSQKRRWDLNAYYFWVMTQGMWELGKDYRELRQEFLRRVFADAGADMQEFYQTIEDGWRKITIPSRWNDDASTMWRMSVVDQGNVEKCRAALERAATKVTHPNSVIFLGRIREAFEEQMGLILKPFLGQDIEINGEFKQLHANGLPENWNVQASNFLEIDGEHCVRIQAGAEHKRWMQNTIAIPVEEYDIYVVKAVFKGRGIAYFGVFNYYLNPNTGNLSQIGGPRAKVEAKDEWQEITYTLQVGANRSGGRKLTEIRPIMGVDENSEVIFKSILLKKAE